MAYTPGKGSLLKLSISAVFTTIAQQVTFDGPKGTKAAIETTDLSLSAATYLAGIVRSGEVAFSGNWDASNATHAQLFTSWGAGTAESWKIVYADSGAAEIAFTGFLTALSFDAAEVDNVVRISGTIQVTGSITITP